MKVTALIVAGGRGSRAAQSENRPKQYRNLAGEMLLARSVRPFLERPSIGAVRVVISPDHLSLYQPLADRFASMLGVPIMGGATRQESARLGLEALTNNPPDIVLIHDAARPFVTAEIIDFMVQTLIEQRAALVACPLTDTLKRVRKGGGTVAETISRDGLWCAQTPQGFHYEPILAAHRRAQAAGLSDFTDDASIAEWAGMPVAIVPGSPGNIKLTTQEDLDMAERLLAPFGGFEPRTGTGFDVHAFAPGDHVWLCGVKIPHSHRLDGHSDADVGLHALTDALLGAIGDGDIGQHFPPSDPQWKGASSSVFLGDAARRVAARGGRVTNVDVTLLCEAPRITAHRDAMRQAIAELLNISADRVGVKATTTERLGFVGRQEGIAAQAVATILLPTPDSCPAGRVR